MKKMFNIKMIAVSLFILAASIVLPSKGFCAPVTYDISGHLVWYSFGKSETTDPDVIAAREAFETEFNNLLWAEATFSGTLIFDNALSVASWDPTYIYMGYSYNVTWESGLAFEAAKLPWLGGGLIDNMGAVQQDATRIWDGFIEGGYLTISGAADETYNTSTTFEHALDFYGCPGLSELYGGEFGGDWAYYGPSSDTGIMFLRYWMEIDSIAPASVPLPPTLLLLGSGLVGLAGTQLRKRRKE